MFGMGGSEIIVILIVALLFLGPDKLPQATKQISKTIRDLKKQSRSLQQQIENDDQIGGAIRDIKSALRGEEPIERPKIKPRPKKELAAGPPESAESPATEAAAEPVVHAHGDPDHVLAPDPHDGLEPDPHDGLEPPAKGALAEKPLVTLPATAGEPDPSVVASDDSKELAAMIKPAAGTIAKGS